MPQLRPLNGSLRRLPAVLIVVAITGFALAIPWTSHSHSQTSVDVAQVQLLSSTTPPVAVRPAPPVDRTPASAHPAAATPRAASVPAQEARDAALGSRGAALAPPAPASAPAPTSASAPSGGSGPAAGAGTTPAATTASAPAPSGYGCGPALAYLSANAAPGFTFQCPGYAYGNQAMTCVNHAPQCAGEKLIAINVPCAAAYMNEASNSWVLTNQRSGAIDPYGYCH